MIPFLILLRSTRVYMLKTIIIFNRPKIDLLRREIFATIHHDIKEQLLNIKLMISWQNGNYNFIVIKW